MKLSGLFGIFLLPLFISHPILAQADHIGSSLQLPPHPRILMLKGEEAIIQQTIANDKIWMQLEQAILDESDQLLSVPPVERIKIGRRLLDKSREALRRIFFLSYAYRMTGDQKYANARRKRIAGESCIQRLEPFAFSGRGRNDHGGLHWL